MKNTSKVASMLLTGPILRAALPLPPGINHSYKIVRIGKAHRLAATPELKAFKDEARLRLYQQDAQLDWPTISAIRASKNKIALQATITFFLSTLWKTDVDAGIKAVIDASFDYMSLNDNLLVYLVTKKRTDAENPRCEIVIDLAEIGG
jgi:Holliday junction resolvase RusA-like endonuclease